MPTDKHPDRDLIVRLDADLSNLTTQFKDHRDEETVRYSELQSTTSQLTKDLIVLTHNVGAIVKAIERSNEMHKVVEMHEARIVNVEAQTIRIVNSIESNQKTTSDSLSKLETHLNARFDDAAKQWGPAVAVFNHWKWLVGGVAAVVAVVGWPTIKMVLQALSS